MLLRHADAGGLDVNVLGVNRRACSGHPHPPRHNKTRHDTTIKPLRSHTGYSVNTCPPATLRTDGIAQDEDVLVRHILGSSGEDAVLSSGMDAQQALDILRVPDQGTP